MAGDAGGASLRQWRESQGWDVPRMAREIRSAARETGEDVAAQRGLVKMIPRWESGERYPRERYRLLYARLGFNGTIPPPARSPEDDPVAVRIAANEQHLAASRERVTSTRDYVKAAKEHAARMRDKDTGAGGRAADLVSRFAALPDEDEIRRMAADPEAASAALRAAATALNALADLMAEGGDDK